MGLIADLDCPHVIPALEGRAPRVPISKLRPRILHVRPRQSGTRGTRPSNRSTGIARDTPLLPRAAAEAVWEEASEFLGEALPAEWISVLTEKAETIYAHSSNYRRRLRGRGDTGRDWLWSFMRHWLAALLREHRPQWFGKLPSRYSAGAPPWEQRIRRSHG
jgi:hypothetical protein